jgi:hypothetical protein
MILLGKIWTRKLIVNMKTYGKVENYKNVPGIVSISLLMEMELLTNKI